MSKIVSIVLNSFFLLSQSQCNSCKGHERSNRKFIENVFQEVIENPNINEEIISKYFSPSYIQCVDGHTLHYNDFVNHMLKQKTLIDSVKVYIDNYIENTHSICTIHRVEAKKKNREKILVKVIAYFQINDGKIFFCDELTYLLKGEKEDQNIGSIN